MLAQTAIDEPVQAHARLCRLHGKLAVHFRGGADLELAGIPLQGQGGRDFLAAALHVGNGILDQGDDTARGGFLVLVQPGKGRELGAQADELLIFLRPDHAVSVLLAVHCFAPSRRSIAARTCRT